MLKFYRLFLGYLGIKLLIQCWWAYGVCQVSTIGWINEATCEGLSLWPLSALSSLRQTVREIVLMSNSSSNPNQACMHLSIYLSIAKRSKSSVNSGHTAENWSWLYDDFSCFFYLVWNRVSACDPRQNKCLAASPPVPFCRPPSPTTLVLAAAVQTVWFMMNTLGSQDLPA